MVTEFTYKLQVSHLSKKNKVSLNKARNFIKGYRRLLKERLYEGNKIVIVGIAEIYPSVRASVNLVFEKEYGYSEQVVDLAKELGTTPMEVHHLLKSYLRMLVMKLRSGYAIKISGVLLVKPDQFDEETLGYVTRLSPTLDKPESMTLRVKHLYGTIEDMEIPLEKLIYRLELNEGLGAPEQLAILDNLIPITYVSEDLIG